ncbi:MAG: MarR family transcriptional regulator [Methanobrevibacter sp.]|uniref:MarR family winged helix-turn-helix transcriptional regulator n=1 Tax=Methanobrevibacter sp. TaxID=66852 RepID=UPI0026DF3C41|nr:MarR family transcriptional regulator [Methanobrevibacter sp.]MDO5848885.1 MarR family transcriptional regulator [Methanobrevibacter sp.]
MSIENNNIPLTACFSFIKQQHYLFLNKVLEDEEINAGQSAFLIYLLFNNRACQDDIANHYKIGKGSVARGIRKLEDLNLISKETDENNRRKCILTLNKDGERIAKKILEANKKWEEEIYSQVDIPKENLEDIMKQVAIKTMEINKKINMEGFDGSGK